MTNNNKEIFPLIPSEYSVEEKSEILKIINEYNSICLEVLRKRTDF